MVKNSYFYKKLTHLEINDFTNYTSTTTYFTNFGCILFGLNNFYFNPLATVFVFSVLDQKKIQNQMREGDKKKHLRKKTFKLFSEKLLRATKE